MEDKMPNEQLIFLHLSDIHFQKWSGDRYDTDQNIRHEIVLDARSVASLVGKPSGILITGDVAFSGSAEEYQNAKIFLAELMTAELPLI
jgi:hypothetical protein